MSRVRHYLCRNPGHVPKTKKAPERACKPGYSVCLLTLRLYKVSDLVGVTEIDRSSAPSFCSLPAASGSHARPNRLLDQLTDRRDCCPPPSTLSFSPIDQDPALFNDLPFPCRGRDPRKPIQIGEPCLLIVGSVQEQGLHLIQLHQPTALPALGAGRPPASSRESTAYCPVLFVGANVTKGYWGELSYLATAGSRIPYSEASRVPRRHTQSTERVREQAAGRK